jgi:hypothetical protein
LEGLLFFLQWKSPEIDKRQTLPDRSRPAILALATGV